MRADLLLASLVQRGSQTITRSPAASIKEEAMVKGFIIPASAQGTVEAREFAGLDDYQQAVGGYIEPVDLPALHATL